MLVKTSENKPELCPCLLGVSNLPPPVEKWFLQYRNKGFLFSSSINVKFRIKISDRVKSRGIVCV